MEYYRAVKIAGEDVVEEEPLPEETLATDLSMYDEDARTIYSGGLTEEPGEETLAE